MALPLNPQVDERRWERECAGKEEYPSESAARAALAYRKRHDPRGHGFAVTWLEIYRCSCCGQWHAGNN